MGKNTGASTIFDFFAKNLAKTLKKHGLQVEIPGISSDERLYFCPLSLRFFLKEDIKIGELTIEHVPPHSLGGEPLVLTSKDINNNDGQTIDKEILEYFKFQNFCLRNGNYPVSIASEDLSFKNIRAELSYSKEKKKFSIISHKKNITALSHKGLFSSWDGTKLHFICDVPTKLNRKSLLKCAYLIAFRHLKYELIFNEKGFKSETYGAVVDSLKNADSELKFPVLCKIGHAPFEDLIFGIINEPSELRAIFVNLTFSLEGSDYKYMVFLPHPDDMNLEKYLSLESQFSMMDNSKKMAIKGIPNTTQ